MPVDGCIFWVPFAAVCVWGVDLPVKDSTTILILPGGFLQRFWCGVFIVPLKVIGASPDSPLLNLI